MRGIFISFANKFSPRISSFFCVSTSLDNYTRSKYNFSRSLERISSTMYLILNSKKKFENSFIRNWFFRSDYHNLCIRYM